MRRDQHETASPARVNVLGVGVSAIDMRGALEFIERWIDERSRHYVCVSGVHGVMESQRDESLRRIHNEAGLVTPDGMPLVWLGKLAGHRHIERVYGPDLLLACCAASVEKGWQHFFYGGAPGVAERLATLLRDRFPGIRIVGVESPPYRDLTTTEDEALMHRIGAADLLWVGLGTPKQERWMHAHLGTVSAKVMIGVGAAFDFLSGTKRQAPRWMRQSGLEWMFRLLSEPGRLWRRYLVNNPLFVWKVALQAIRVRHYDIGPKRP